MRFFSVVLIGLGVWLIVDGFISVAKYSKQSFPEQLVRIIRAIVGVIIVLIAITEN